MMWKKITKEATEKYKDKSVTLLCADNTTEEGYLHLDDEENPMGATEEFVLSTATHFIPREELLKLPKE